MASLGMLHILPADTGVNQPWTTAGTMLVARRAGAAATRCTLLNRD
ncbi:MAG: hypothetical protein QOE61_3793 [Micromonosporaceae bacterium]|nr:hypothetical protein [Micromonosporaceae bacterium]